jgi:hypothetical protein
MGTEVAPLFPWSNRSEEETDHLPRTTSEVKNKWSDTSTAYMVSWFAEGQPYLLNFSG